MRDERKKTTTGKGEASDGLREMAELAMQVSATLAGIPATCRRQVCRRLDRCHMRLEKDCDINCGGRLDAGLVVRAQSMLAFAARLGEKSGMTEETLLAIEKRLTAGPRAAS